MTGPVLASLAWADGAVFGTTIVPDGTSVIELDGTVFLKADGPLFVESQVVRLRAKDISLTSRLAKIVRPSEGQSVSVCGVVMKSCDECVDVSVSCIGGSEIIRVPLDQVELTDRPPITKE